MMQGSPMVKQNPESSSVIDLRLNEWQMVGPKQDERLRDAGLASDPEVLRIAPLLAGKLDIRPAFGGVELRSNSFVGRAEVGRLRITVMPKLDGLPLTRLLCYAYGLRDMSLHEDTVAPMTAQGFEGLLVSMLATEVTTLVQRGLPWRYMRDEAWLESPKGRILIDKWARARHAVPTSLPCRFDERSPDWPVNRVVLAGLHLAVGRCGDPMLRQRMQKLAESFAGVRSAERLDSASVARAKSMLTRLSDHCASALTLIDLLVRGQGLDIETPHGSTPLPGFLFDMNRFFQRLLSRFLRENLPGWQVADESAIRGLFSVTSTRGFSRRTPAPRPDYAIARHGEPPTYLDAKYRDLANRSLPAEWLYQLSLYAVASARSTSVLLYATMSNTAADERIRIRSPGSSAGAGGEQLGTVVLRPVLLEELARVLADGGAASNTARTKMASRLTTTIPPSHFGEQCRRRSVDATRHVA
jgi:5-methylcytosine-specific restriction enzyme subunit McrC